MKHNPYKIVKMFEEEIAEYTGAKYAVSVDSCTNALFLCCTYLNVDEVIIPMRLIKMQKKNYTKKNLLISSDVSNTCWR